MFTIKERNSAVDSHDLMIKLKNFLVNNTDFVMEKDGEVDLDNEYVFSKNGFYYNLKSFFQEVPFSNPTATDISSWEDAGEDRNEGICGNISTAYNVATEWDRQAGYYTSGAPILRTLGNIIEYDFFFNGDIVYIVCQYNTLKFSHFCFGKMTSFYNETIPFISGNFYHNFGPLTLNDTEIVNIYNNHSEDSQNIMIKNGASQTFYGNVLTNSFLNQRIELNVPRLTMQEINRSKNVFSGKHTAFEGTFYKQRKINNQIKYYPSEKLSDIFFVYFQDFIEKEEFTIGVNKYIAYPFTQKTSPFDDTDINSSGLGVLIKVDNYFI